MKKRAKRDVWEVWQGRTLVCSDKMGLTERQARTKVENERRLGYFMEAHRAAALSSPPCQECGHQHAGSEWEHVCTCVGCPCALTPPPPQE
jgi:hypothetical protein